MERLTARSEQTGMTWFVDQEYREEGFLLEPCEMNPHHCRMAIEKLWSYENEEKQKASANDNAVNTGGEFHLVLEEIKSQLKEARFPITDLKQGVLINGIQQTDDAVLYKRAIEIVEEISKKVQQSKIMNIVATERDGIQTKNFVIKVEVYSDTIDIESAIAKACTAFCRTKEGQEIYHYNCNCFNYGDFDMYVPNEICEKYGFRKINQTDAIEVNFDQQLVEESEVFPEE